MTRDQNLVVNALQTLGFEVLPPEGEPPYKTGEPTKLKIADEALDALKGKTITVGGEGVPTVK